MKLTIVEFVECCMALWRVVNLICNEDGPFDVFPKIREWAHTMCHKYKLCKDYGFNMLFECEYCNSMYTGTALVVALTFWHTQTMYVVHVLALSTAVILIKRVHEWLQHTIRL